MADERILVLGLGNPLMRDEGVGVRVLEVLGGTLQFPANVELVDAGTMGMSILPLFRECDYLLIVDAVDGTGEEPGTVVRIQPEDFAQNQVMHSLHDIRFVDVLGAAELMGSRPAAECVGVQIEDMSDLGIGLTPAVQEAVPRAVEAVLAVLAEHGVTAAPKAEASEESRILSSIREVEPDS